MDEDLKRGIYGIVFGILFLWFVIWIGSGTSVPAGFGIFFIAGIIIVLVSIGRFFLGIWNTIKKR